MKKYISYLIATFVFLMISAQVYAAPIIMEGDYVRTAVSDNGTLGYGDATDPGLHHDASGTGTFTIDDYLTPGTPWEIFSVKSDQTGIVTNNNSGSTYDSYTSSSLTDLSAGSSYDQHVIWEGSLDEAFTISTETYFNDGDERVSMTTTITATADLADLSFLRAIDPDPDVYTYGSYNTVNGRGYDANTDGDFDDTGDIAPENWVHSEGTSTGLTLSLYSNSAYDHNTGVSAPWSSDPDSYLAGVDDGDGDYAIGLAFAFGDLAFEESVTFDYAYIMGGTLDTTVVTDPVIDPVIDPVPEPATMFLLATGLAGLAGFIRKKRS